MKISDYIVQEKIYQGRNFTIYRAIKENDTLSRVLKFLDVKTAHSVNIANSIKNEYDFLKQVNSPYVIKAVDWIENKNVAAIVLEDIDGISLKDEINKGWYPIEKFIPMAIRIAAGLADVHRENIIHKDINLSNIIRNPQTGDLKLIDFNLASKYDIKVSYLGNPEKLQPYRPHLSSVDDQCFPVDI